MASWQQLAAERRKDLEVCSQPVKSVQVIPTSKKTEYLTVAPCGCLQRFVQAK